MEIVEMIVNLIFLNKWITHHASSLKHFPIIKTLSKIKSRQFSISILQFKVHIVNEYIDKV